MYRQMRELWQIFRYETVVCNYAYPWEVAEYLSVSLSVCLSLCLSICLSLSLSMPLSLSLSLFASLSVYLSLCLSLCLSMPLSLSLSVRLSLYASLCLSMHISLSVSLSVSMPVSLSVCLASCVYSCLCVCPSVYPVQSTCLPTMVHHLAFLCVLQYVHILLFWNKNKCLTKALDSHQSLNCTIQLPSYWCLITNFLIFQKKLFLPVLIFFPHYGRHPQTAFQISRFSSCTKESKCNAFFFFYRRGGRNMTYFNLTLYAPCTILQYAYKPTRGTQFCS